MDEFETLTPAKKKEGIVFVISGPSGSGKGTVIGHLKEMYPNLGLAVSATTRDMRPGEREGVEYFFKTREEFERMIRDGEVLDTYETRFGIRTVRLDRTSTTDRDGNGEFCFRVNGKKIFGPWSNMEFITPSPTKLTCKNVSSSSI